MHGRIARRPQSASWDADRSLLVWHIAFSAALGQPRRIITLCGLNRPSVAVPLNQRSNHCVFPAGSGVCLRLAGRAWLGQNWLDGARHMQLAVTAANVVPLSSDGPHKVNLVASSRVLPANLKICVRKRQGNARTGDNWLIGRQWPPLPVDGPLVRCLAVGVIEQLTATPILLLGAVEVASES
jgi:hypothetical protein